MLLRYNKMKKYSLLITTAICFLSTSLFASDNAPRKIKLTASELMAAIQKSDPFNKLKIAASPEVLSEVNHMRNNKRTRAYMQTALERMEHDKPFLQSELKNTEIPQGILALPIVESGYRPLSENENRLNAAGIWQIIPSTAQYLGLVVNPLRDDRMNTQLSTVAALNYLNEMHKKFEDWKLAVIAYEYGENETRRLMNTTGSRDAWTIARSPVAPKDMKKYLAKFDASVVVMQNPSLVA